MNEDQIFEKYAEAAVTLLEENYPNQWNDDEAIKLAQELINSDIEEAEMQEKVAEKDAEGRIMARAFYDELQKLGGVKNVWAATKNLGGKAVDAGKGAWNSAKGMPGKAVKGVSNYGSKIEGNAILDKYFPAGSPSRTQKSLLAAKEQIGKFLRKHPKSALGIAGGAVAGGGSAGTYYATK